MEKSKIQNLKSKIFLGIDGGQSHTEAIIADENGIILGRGLGGASNHAEIPGGRERLENAIINAVGEALKNAKLPPIEEMIFASAHCGMTGGAIYKEEIIGAIFKAEKLDSRTRRADGFVRRDCGKTRNRRHRRNRFGRFRHERKRGNGACRRTRIFVFR